VSRTTVIGLSVVECNGVVRITCGCGGLAVLRLEPRWPVLLATFVLGLTAGLALMMAVVALT